METTTDQMPFSSMPVGKPEATIEWLKAKIRHCKVTMNIVTEDSRQSLQNDLEFYQHFLESYTKQLNLFPNE